jgi:hypothetical protein
MKKVSLAAAFALLSAACGDVKVAMDDINDANVDAAQFAIFANDQAANADLEFSTVAVAISDREDLCTQLEADPNAVGNLADIQAVVLLAFKVEAAGQATGFVKGDKLEGNTSFIDFLATPAAGQVSLLSSVKIREGGVDLVAASDDGVNAGTGQLKIDAFTAGEELAISFSGTLTSDIADDARFNADSNNDGVNDFQSISAALDVKVRSATFCAALLQ